MTEGEAHRSDPRSPLAAAENVSSRSPGSAYPRPRPGLRPKAFGIRLTLAFVAAIGLAGGVLYVLQARTTEANETRADLETYSALVRHLEAMLQGQAAGQESALGEVQEVLEVVQTTSGSHQVRLVDRNGNVIAAGKAADVGKKHIDDHLRGALFRGELFNGIENEGDQTLYEYVFPVKVPTGRLAFEVELRSDHVQEQLAVLRRQMVLNIAIGLILGLPLFYFAGGRRLSKLYSDVHDALSREQKSRRVAEEAEKKIERLNAELEQRIVARTSDLEEANRRLVEAKDSAEEANRAKSEFLSRTSHELRTPLNAILGFGQLLETSTLSTDDRQSVHQILKGGRHLLDLINEVLDISQFDTPGASLSIEPVLVDEIVSESVDLIRPLAHARKIELKIDPFDPSWFVLADRQRLRQVLHNLMSNAAKFNREGGTVWASGVATSTKTLAIRVSDTGPGIAAEQLGRLFSPFDRLGAERTDADGTGLGLALSKALVEAMGGRITVDSQEGHGSTFSVELDRTDDPGHSVEDDAEGTISPRSVAGTILCVEDNASNLALIQRVFSHRPGVTVLTASEGLLGVELARQHLPSLVLMDLHLPDISGEEALRILRQDDRTRDIPILVTSADATPARIARLQEAGADEYLTKPLKAKELLDLIDEMLAKPRHTSPGARRHG